MANALEVDPLLAFKHFLLLVFDLLHPQSFLRGGLPSSRSHRFSKQRVLELSRDRLNELRAVMELLVDASVLISVGSSVLVLFTGEVVSAVECRLSYHFEVSRALDPQR